MEKRRFPFRKPTAHITLPCTTALACDNKAVQVPRSPGFSLNIIKSEVISRSGDVSHPQFISFHQLSIDNATLLEAPIFAGPALNDSLSALYGDLEVAVERLQLISAHDTFILLKSCLGGPKLMFYALHLAVAIRF